MWLLNASIFVVLMSWIICLGLKLMQKTWLQFLERQFIYSSQQLQETLRQRALDERAGDYGPNQKEHSQQQEQLKKNKTAAMKAKRINNLKSPPIKNRLNLRIEQCCDVIAAGLRLVLEDEVTSRFAAAQPPAGEWNLLTRNLREKKRRLNLRLRLIWLTGWLIRYVLLLPIRAIGCSASVVVIALATAILGGLPNWPFKRPLVEYVLRQCFRLTACCIPIMMRFHNVENRPTLGISVCNHTSPLDVLALMCDVHYSLTGQRHDGILGIMQRSLVRASPHMWFNRRALGDREALGMLLRLHVGTNDRPPILIFPEGTCINNTAVMQFKKGSFTVSNVVYPVAVRYDRRFGEAYWDSTRYSMLRYMLMVISSWCIACDIWYLPPVRKLPDETSIDFSNRVKAAIAAQAGIDDLPWDGNLKRWSPVRDWQ
ncbi:glycerol-3-phosphate acyltransferase 3-like [Drosophila tropicalis]|uniref:glycerol-3-phosphate acyltransferase 3-like n=1 Tax=Drosophila tropicalis TaxID=46794 RepID=UPI0035AC2718